MNDEFNDMVNEVYYNLVRTKSNNLVIPNFIIEILPTKLYWKNIKEFLDVIKRDPQHFLEYIKNQYTNREIHLYSSNISDGLIIHGKKLKNTDIYNITNKYINTFVICPSCMKHDTIMEKLQKKKYNFICNNCNMSKYL